MRRVVVTGLGAITPLGVGVRTTWSRLLAGESGITTLNHLEPRQRWKDVTSTVAGLVPSEQWRPSDWLTPTELRRMSTFAQYAVASAQMALDDAGWHPTSQEDKEATGVCLGSGIGNLEEIYETSLAFEQGGYKKVSPLFVPKILINMAAGHISMKHGLQGPNHAVTTACTTGAHSVGDASRFIAFGDADVMVAGGTESCIHPLTFAGFGRARSLSTKYNDNPHASCRPFDGARDGFVVAEGSAVFVLEELEHAKARGAQIYAEVKGYGCSGDSYHMTAPREDGHGAFRAMRAALKNAGVKPAEVDYINAHATGTQIGDAAEASAIRTLMTGEEGVADESKVTVSSTKGAVGHLLGAAGAVEAMFSVLAVKEAPTRPTTSSVGPGTPGTAPDEQTGPVSGALAGALRGKFQPNLGNPYILSNQLDKLYKICAAPAAYTIAEDLRKAEMVPKTEDGEELGTPHGPWLQIFNLSPSFSSWSHVTMLHMYLVIARMRCLDRDTARTMQAQFVDNFFFDCERVMHLNHGMTSSALRQRYLKDIFMQWRGLIAAYDEGLAKKSDRVLAAAVWRNLFKAREDTDLRSLAAVVAWMRVTLKDLEGMEVDEIVSRSGSVFLRDPRGMFKLVDEPSASLKGLYQKEGGDAPKADAVQA
ncbi:hypothetical protein ACHAQA_001205 [Verticillium albo-atrum]